jgi:hypothetical protein
VVGAAGIISLAYTYLDQNNAVTGTGRQYPDRDDHSNDPAERGQPQ